MNVGQFNSRLDQIERALEEGGSGSGLPEVTDEDNGDVLAVVNGEWSKAEAPSGLPEYTLADEGKVLTVKKEAAGQEYIFNEDLQFLNYDNVYISVELTQEQVEPFLLLSVGDSVVVEFDEESIDCNVLYNSAQEEYVIGDEEEYIYISYTSAGGFAGIKSNLPSGTYNLKVKSNAYVAVWNIEHPYLVLKAVSYIGNQNDTDYYTVNLTYEEVKAAFNINTLKPVFVVVPKYNHGIQYESPLVLQVNLYNDSEDYFDCMLNTVLTLNYDDIITVRLGQYNHPTLGLIFILSVGKQSVV